MNIMRIAFFLPAVGLLVSGCSNQPLTTAPIANSNTGVQNKPVNEQNDKLRRQLEEIAASSKGRVGVAATVLETGEAVFLNGAEQFPMQSVYKVPISMAVLKEVDKGKVKLDQKVRVTKDDYIGRAAHSPIRDRFPEGTELTVEQLMRWAISESDGTASDVLMRLAGGPDSINAYLRELDVDDMMVLNTEKQFAENHDLQFRNYATPEAAVSLLKALNEGRGISQPHRELVLNLMVESRPGQKRLKGLLPLGTVVAHKTGTSGTDDKGVTAATNDIGIITLPDGRHLAIAVFVGDSSGNLDIREATIAKSAKAVWDTFTQRK